MNWMDCLDSAGSIAVYGAGYVAETLWITLEEKGRSGLIRCFVVTQRGEGQTAKHGRPVLSLEEYMSSRPSDERIVIAAHHSIAGQMEETLKSRGLRAFILPPFRPGMAFGEPLCEKDLSVRRILKEQAAENHWITVRYAALKALRAGEKPEESMGLRIYRKTQSLHAGPATVEARIRAMEQLLCSMEEKGFLENCPVQMDQACRIIDGLHRTACAALLGIETIPCLLYQTKDIYDILFPAGNRLPHEALIKAGLDRKEQDFLSEQREELRHIYPEQRNVP